MDTVSRQIIDQAGFYQAGGRCKMMSSLNRDALEGMEAEQVVFSADRLLMATFRLSRVFICSLAVNRFRMGALNHIAGFAQGYGAAVGPGAW